MTARQPLIRVTAMPADTNPYGGVFGGWLMSQMALGAGALASREGEGKAVVVSATDFAFPGAMQVGDELSVYCEIAATGNTSLTISCRSHRPRAQWRSNYHGRKRNLQIRPARRGRHDRAQSRRSRHEARLS